MAPSAANITAVEPVTGPPPRRTWLTSHPLVVDVFVAIGYILLMLPGAVHALFFDAGPEWARVLGLVSTIVIGAVLLFRRRMPITVLVTAFAVVMVKTVVCGFIDPLGVALAAYAAGAFAPARRAWTALPAVAAGTVVTVILGTPPAPEQRMTSATTLILLLSAFIPAALVGFLVRARSTLRRSEHERFVQRVNERVQAGELSVARERAALSREMHDVVGHSLTAIINLSDGALRAGVVNPDAYEEGLRRINMIAREALGETRVILDELRSEEEAAPRTPASPSVSAGMLTHPTVGRTGSGASAAKATDFGLQGLVDTASSTGLAATLVVNGEPRPDLLTEEARCAIHRMVQEACTNAMRHAREATRLTVTLSYAPDAVTVQVLDDGQGESVAKAGNGLRGIHERATQMGGEMHCGPAPTGGWHVTVVIPLNRERRP